MKHINKQNGFTAVELLITLFIAAAFLLSGLQLYAVIIKDSGETRAQANASNVVNDYLQRYKSSAANPCTVQTPLTNQSLTVSGLSNVTITVVISCPYGLSSVSKVLVTLQYNNPQKTVSNATYTKPQDIVTNGLVLNLDAGDTNSVRGKKSIINWDSWTVGAGGTTRYSPNGDGNSRILDTNPWNATDVVWDTSNQDAASDADGGWNGDMFPVDSSKTYRFTTWVRRKTVGNGTFYMGLQGGGALVLNRSNGGADGNPYFYNSGWWGNVNQWYLVVGYVWPAGSGTGAIKPESGVYAVDGTKVVSTTTDYVWQPGTTSSNHRSYLYYSTDTTTNQQWYQPRVDVVDGTEPSLADLLNNTGNTWYDLSGNGNNGTLVNGIGYTNANGGALSFDGVNDYVSFANNTLELGTGDFTIDLFAYIGDSTYAWQRLFGKKGIGGAEQGYSVYWGGANQKLMWSTANGSAGHEYWTNDTIAINTWHHIVMVRDSSDARIGYYYVDGQREDIPTVPAIDDVTKSAAVPYAGSLGGTSLQFKGSISNIHVYNRALNSNEIQQNFSALRGRYGI